jgi:hypothetical protein
MNNIPKKELFTIEVEYDNENLSIDIYNSIIKTVTKFNGLQLLLISGNNRLPMTEKNMSDSQLSISYVLSCKNQVSKLISDGEYSSAFLSLWIFAEYLMERLTRQTPIPTESVSSILMIHHLYQQSIISLKQFEIAIYLNSLHDILSKNHFQDIEIRQNIDRLWDLVDDFIALEIRGFP